MDISYLYTFKEVAKWESYTRTGEELGYAQSSVTTQIKKLEAYYQVKLFERNGRRMRLTQPGEELLYYVQQMIDMEESVMKVSQKRNVRGTIRIGTVESLAAYFITGTIKALKEKNPHLRIQLESGLCPNLKGGIIDGHYDLAIVLDQSIHHPDLMTLPIKEEKMVIVSSPEHPLAERNRIGLKQLDEETLILTEKDCPYRNSFEQLLKEGGVHPRSVISFSSIEAIKQCVADDLGVAMLPEMTVKRELKEGTLSLLGVQCEEVNLMIQLIYHKRKWLSPSLHYLVELITCQEK